MTVLLEEMPKADTAFHMPPANSTPSPQPSNPALTTTSPNQPPAALPATALTNQPSRSAALAQVIKLDGSFNTRCFGGQNPWLVRSGNLDNLTDLGKAQLAALGLQRVVDLRDPAEKGANTQHHRFPTVSIPIFGQIGEPGKQHSFTSYYRIILQRNGGPLARAVAAIAQASGPALVHCAIGKDRTGLVVALVLLAAGATHEQVVADYARSAAGQPASRVAAVTKQLAELGLVPGSVQAVEHLQRELASPPEAMTNALAYLDEVGGWRNYLLTHGVSQLLLNRLADRPL